MSERIIVGFSVDVNEEGYLTNFSQWNKEIAIELAKEEGISELTEQHWKVIDFFQKDYKESEKIPTIRRLNKVAGIATNELYQLFPDGPLKKAAKVSGLKKPESCI